MKRKNKSIICGCKEASLNCYLLCAKGRRINPDKVYQIPQWKKGR